MEILFSNNNNQVFYNNILNLLYVYRKNRLITTYTTKNKTMDQITEQAKNLFIALKKLDI